VKKSISLIILFFCLAEAFAQIAPDAELTNKLRGKTKFSDIKQTVNNHLYAKLDALSPADSAEKKSINRQLKMWNRKFWISENYTNTGGEVVNAAELNYNAYLQLNNQRTNQSESQLQPWVLAGPYNSDDGIGRFDKLVFHPTNPDIIFGGSTHGGLFRTTNGGDDWFPVSQFLSSLGISGIAVNPVNPDIIYVLTGDGNSSNGSFVNQYLYRSASLGVFKTYDGGISWFPTSILAPISTSYQGMDLIIDPNNPETLIAATSVGIYRTTNGGNAWNLVGSTGTNNIWDLKFKPGDPNTVYAAGNNSFWRSIDNGANFTAININGLAGANRISIGVTPNNPNRVVLLAGPGSMAGGTFQGIFSSANSGQNFSLLTQTPDVFSNTIGSGGSDQSIYDHCIAISPTNENDIFVGGLCVWSSGDGGFNWLQVSAYRPNGNPLGVDYMHPDIHAVSFNPLNNNLYCANDGGIYLLSGSDWVPVFNGATTSQFYHFERENDEGWIWGGTQDNGILVRSGGGTFFNFAGGDGYDVMTDHDYLVDDGNDNDIYFSVNQKIYKDIISGFREMTPPGSQGFFANLAMSPTLQATIYAGYSNATYMCTNANDDLLGFDDWTNLGNVPGNWCISTCPSNADILYVAGTNQISRLQLPATWTNLTASLVSAGYNSNLKITDIDVHPDNDNIVYVSTGGNTANAKVFRTLNGGATWENLAFNLPNVPVFSVKRDNNNGVYAGTSIGVFYKRNLINYWEPFSNNLPPVPVTEIELWPAANEVWVSTFGRGLWVTTAYNNCTIDLPLTGYVAGNHYSEASNSITSSQSIGGGEGTFVKYNTGNQIKLVPGFKVYYGSRFKTFTTGCGGQVELSKPNKPEEKTDSIKNKEPVLQK
jgi:hypothetical protein